MTAAASLSATDLLLATYLLWGVFKGWRRRLGRELPALLKLALLLAWLWGFGAFRWLRTSLSGLLEAYPVTQGMLGGLLAIIIAIALLHLLRERLAIVIERRLSSTAARAWGALTGLLRTALWGSVLLLLLSQLPWLGDALARSISATLLSALFTSGAALPPA